jgi:hypothetical protein
LFPFLVLQSFNVLGCGPWSLPSTFTTQASVPAQPDPPVQVASSKVRSNSSSWCSWLLSLTG